MLLKFATKRDVNGNRYYLTIDTDKRTFSRVPHIWYRDEFTEVTKKDFHELIARAKAEEFREIA